jgi:hypothetical protein
MRALICAFCILKSVVISGEVLLQFHLILEPDRATYSFSMALADSLSHKKWISGAESTKMSSVPTSKSRDPASSSLFESKWSLF